MKSGGPSVLLVDDEPRLRAQLRAVLDDHEVVVVGEAGTGRAGVELACRLQPQVGLMDLRMPELDGIARPGCCWRASHRPWCSSCPPTTTRH